MTITVSIRNVYGNDLIYPICDTAQLLCSLTARKTLHKHDIDVIKQLGYDVEVVNTATL